MRRDGRRYQRVTLPMFQERFGISEGRNGSFAVGRRKANQRFSQHASHACGFSSFGYFFLKIVHVGYGGGATTQHLQQAETR